MPSNHKSPSARATSLNAPDDDTMEPLLDVMTDEAEIAAAEKKAAEDSKAKNLIISFILMVIVGLGNKIFQVLQFIPMYNYPLFVNLLTTFVYIPLSFAYIIPVMKYGTLITEEATAVPKYKFAVMGFLDSLAGIMQSLSVNYIANGSLVILLTQAAIPASMIISKIFLSTKYKVSQFIGALVVAVGIVIALLPSLEHPNSGHGRDRVAWSIVLILSCVPMCLSSVYKEKALGDADIDAVYMNGWIAVFQFLFAIPLLFPSAVASNVKISDLPDNLYDGLKCLGQVDSVFNQTSVANTTMSLLGDTAATSDLHVDNCYRAPVYVVIYLIFNLGYNVLILLILKFGSSNILWLAMTVLVPLANFAFAFDFMPQHAPLNVEDVIGLICILAGLITYRFWSRLAPAVLGMCRKSKDPEDDKLQALLGQSPGVATPMRGTNIHTSKRKKPAASNVAPRGRTSSR